MRKFRVEVEDGTITTRETWVEAEGVADAEAQVKAMDWSTFQEVSQSTTAQIVYTEVCEDD